MEQREGAGPGPLDEAAAWFTELGGRSVPVERLRRFREWRRDPANAAAYADVERLWRQAGALAEDPDIVAAVEAAAARGQARASVARGGGQAWRGGFAGLGGAWGWLSEIGLGEGEARRRWRGLALGLAAVSTVGLLFVGFGALPRRYESAAGAPGLVRLADGSKVELAAGSQVAVRLGPRLRRVALEQGSAVFDVAHDARRPFEVSADGGVVRALGTRFRVRRLEGGAEVVLMSGRVSVRGVEARAPAVVLAPSQAVRVEAGRVGRPIAVRAGELAGSDGAQAGPERLRFASTPLAEAVAQVNRGASRPLRLDAPELADRPVSGSFEAGDTLAFASAAVVMFGLEVRSGPRGELVLEQASAARAKADAR
jgi:transmembrane sensor